MVIIDTIVNLKDSIQLSSEFIPQALSLVIKYTDHLKSFFGDVTSEYFIVLIVVALLTYLLHGVFKSTKQSLPKPRGKK